MGKVRCFLIRTVLERTFFSNGMIFHLYMYCNIEDQGGVYSNCGPKSAFQTPNEVVPMEFSESLGLVSLVWDLQGYTPEVSPEKSPSKKGKLSSDQNFRG